MEHFSGLIRQRSLLLPLNIRLRMSPAIAPAHLRCTPHAHKILVKSTNVAKPIRGELSWISLRDILRTDSVIIRQMKRMQTLIPVIVAMVAFTHFTNGDTIGLFGLATDSDKGKSFDLLKPMLPSGLGELQIGDSPAQVLLKRKNADTKQTKSDEGLYEEVVTSDKWIKGNLHFFNVRYGYNEGESDSSRGLDSIFLDGQYIDETMKFPQTKSLISACFVALGNPDHVIAVKSHYEGNTNNNTLYLYWNRGKSPVFLRIISESSIQQNLFMKIKLPRRSEREAPMPKGLVLDIPTPSNFKTFYEQWLSKDLKYNH